MMGERDQIANSLRSIVDSYGNAWGFQYRNNFGLEVRTSIPSLLGKFMTEGFAATDGKNKDRKYPEVFLGMGQKFARFVVLMSEEHREIAFAHYVIADVHLTRKATSLGIGKSQYYNRLDGMRAAMLPHLLKDASEVE